MNYMRMLRADIANGPGFRVTLWVARLRLPLQGLLQQGVVAL